MPSREERLVVLISPNPFIKDLGLPLISFLPLPGYLSWSLYSPSTPVFQPPFHERIVGGLRQCGRLGQAPLGLPGLQVYKWVPLCFPISVCISDSLPVCPPFNRLTDVS